VEGRAEKKRPAVRQRSANLIDNLKQRSPVYESAPTHCAQFLIVTNDIIN